MLQSWPLIVTLWQFKKKKHLIPTVEQVVERRHDNQTTTLEAYIVLTQTNTVTTKTKVNDKKIDSLWKKFLETIYCLPKSY